MSNMQKWRFNDVLGYLLFLGIGVFLGMILGQLVMTLLLSPFLRPIGLPEEVFSVCAWTLRCAGALWVGQQAVGAQSKYYILYNLKRRHRLTFFQVRHMNPVLDNPKMDMLWAISYVLFETFVPVVLGGVIGAITIGVLWELLGLSSIIAALFTFLWANSHCHVIAYKLFARYDLERELREAPLTMSVMTVVQKEQKLMDAYDSQEEGYQVVELADSKEPAESTWILYAEDEHDD